MRDVLYNIYMRKNSALIFIEENNYTLKELRGTPVPVFILIPNDNAKEELEVAFVSETQYQPSRRPTEIEQHMINRLFQEMQQYKESSDTHEFKFVSYDFSLDNNE